MCVCQCVGQQTYGIELQQRYVIQWYVMISIDIFLFFMFSCTFLLFPRSPSIHKQICRKCSAKSLSHLYKWSVALTDLTCSIKIIVATHFHQKIFIFSKNPWPHGRNQHQHATCAVSCRAICPAANTGLQHQVGIPTGPGPDDLGYRPGNPRHPMQAPACSSICIYN